MKKVYNEPQLTVFGDVETLTQKGKRRHLHRHKRAGHICFQNHDESPVSAINVLAVMS